ncbi:hypothetical protein Syun_017549 [Stephania yunnanensis]|uniref:Uncharacterized protein n=1 Tax=Stephania yunnanensis TaxID=152371 RepID=A0AAP0P2H6_9MAGN
MDEDPSPYPPKAIPAQGHTRPRPYSPKAIPPSYYVGLGSSTKDGLLHDELGSSEISKQKTHHRPPPINICQGNILATYIGL